MKPKTNVAIVVACSVSLIISIIALCLSVPRSQELDFDYLGLLVGIQSLIVTILIGWNIYCLVDLKGLRKEQEDLKTSSYIQIQRTAAMSCHAVSDVYYRYLVGNKPNGDDYNLIYYRLSEIYHLSIIGDYKFCEAIIQSLLEIFVEPKKANFKDRQMEELLRLAARVKCQELIPNFIKFITMLAQMSDKVRV